MSAQICKTNMNQKPIIKIKSKIVPVESESPVITESKPVKQEVKSEVKPEAKPKVKFVVKLDIKQVKPDVNPQAKPEVAPETKPEAKPEVELKEAGPNKKEIEEINNLLKRINDLSEEKNIKELWVSQPILRNFLLTMKDILEIEKNETKKYYVIEPQTYGSITEFGGWRAAPEYFYEYQGDAVTGSGADQWILYKKGLIETLKSVVNEMESHDVTAKLEAKPEPKLELETKPEAEPKPEAKPEPKPELETKLEPKLELEPKPQKQEQKSTVFVVYQYRDYRRENCARIIGVFYNKEKAYEVCLNEAKKYAEESGAVVEETKKGWNGVDTICAHDGEDYENFCVVSQPIVDEEPYECYCMDCGETIREHEGLTGNDLEAWFTEDDELKLCPDCDK